MGFMTFKHLLVSCCVALACHLSPAVAAPDAAQQPSHSFWQDADMLKDALPSATAVIEQVRDKASDLVLDSMNFLGVPYRRGGNSEMNGFDCSGFTRYVFEQSLGRLLPRRAAEQANDPSLLAIHSDDLKPGDLVFFNTMKHAFSHVGIYVGEGKFIHAPRTGKAVQVEDMRQAYWSKRFNGARRVPALAAALPPESSASSSIDFFSQLVQTAPSLPSIGTKTTNTP
jgi:cell wall-associated NlpC family hydrolase